MTVAEQRLSSLSSAKNQPKELERIENDILSISNMVERKYVYECYETKVLQVPFPRVGNEDVVSFEIALNALGLLYESTLSTAHKIRNDRLATIDFRLEVVKQYDKAITRISDSGLEIRNGLMDNSATSKFLCRRILCSRRESWISMTIDFGGYLERDFKATSSENRQMILSKIKHVIGRHPRWYVDEIKEKAKQ